MIFFIAISIRVIPLIAVIYVVKNEEKKAVTNCLLRKYIKNSY
jgi:hypothetical protein